MRLAVATLLALSLWAAAAEARPAQLGVRVTPMRERPRDTISLCPMLSLSLGEHLWVGAGYELIQDYDVIWWKSDLEGHKPITLSGIRAGAWYRGGADRNGFSYGVGGIYTLANRLFSLESKPSGLDSGTYVMDFGGDASAGWIWNEFRLELFATPAWSYGKISSPAIHKDETYSAFTYRVGVELSWRLGW
jgi:hypothetical protein